MMTVGLVFRFSTRQLMTCFPGRLELAHRGDTYLVGFELLGLSLMMVFETR